ncbi:hypothetical protein [Gemmatimonas sp.]|uniref:hypothetical protein n=1 Tax=Gemmatimonas sp. TaxID=1962908 RepID=UPI0039830B75
MIPSRVRSARSRRDNTGTWNLRATDATRQGPKIGGGGGFGGAPQSTGNINDPGFPAGFNARAIEARGTGAGQPVT